MVKPEMINLLATSTYEAICRRAMAMVDEAFPDLDERSHLLAEAIVAAGVTAAIQTFHEAGVLHG